MAYSVATKKTWARILDDIEDSLGKWGFVAQGWKVDTLLAPRSATKTYQSIDERTVTLHWTRKGKPYAITMKHQPRAVDNLLVIWLILETLRLNDARGYAAEIASVYAQEFPALPGPGVNQQAAPAPATTPYTLLHLMGNAPIEVCEAAYRALTKIYHPDMPGGSAAMQQRLNQAIEAIRKEKQ